MEKRNTVIVGAGISGLTIANTLIRNGYDRRDILILEASKNPGGLIQTTKENGYIIEWGPEGLRGNSSATAQIMEMARVSPSPSTDQSKLRYIVKEGKLHALPTSPIKAITTPIVGLKDKFRLLAEPFVRKKEEDETVLNFFERRFGKGSKQLVDAFVSGIFGGDPDRLSIEYAFPMLKQLERMHGSLIKGMVKMKKKGNRATTKQPFLVSTDQGMSGIINALANNVEIQYHAKVEEIRDTGSEVEIETIHGTVKSKRAIIATGTFGMNRISISGERMNVQPEQALVTVVGMAFDESAFSVMPKGYGFLVPEAENRFVLGVLYSSNLFLHRAPKGKILLRCFVGGSRHPERATADISDLQEKIMKDLHDLIGVRKPPEYIWKLSHSPKGIPQMTTMHENIIQWKKRIESVNQNIYLAGIGWTGISCETMINEGIKLAESIAIKE